MTMIIMNNIRELIRLSYRIWQPEVRKEAEIYK